MKLPDKEPPCVTQAAEVTRPDEDGLENVQPVSVGRKPLPLIETSKPTRAVPALRTITGWGLTPGERRDANDPSNTKRSNHTVDLKEASSCPI